MPDGLTTIGNHAFISCTALTTLALPDGLTTIGDRASYHCTALATLTLPDGLCVIHKDAFSHCTALVSLTLPNGLTTIGNNAFSGCTALATLTLPESLTTIGDRAFYNCTALATLTLPESLTTIGDRAFYNCTSLATPMLFGVRTGHGAFGGDMATSRWARGAVNTVRRNVVRLLARVTGRRSRDPSGEEGDAHRARRCSGLWLLRLRLQGLGSSIVYNAGRASCGRMADTTNKLEQCTCPQPRAEVSST